MKHNGAMLKTFLTLIAFALVILPSTYAINSYSMTYHMTNTSTTAGTIEGIAFKEGEGCTASLSIRPYMLGTGFDLGVNYFSPDSTPIGTASRLNKNSLVCSDLGTFSTSTDLSTIMESYMDYTSNADNGNITLTTTYACSETSLFYDIEADMNDFDSFGNVVYRFGGTSTGFVSNASITSNAYASNYYNCFSNLHTHAPYIQIGSSGSSSVDYRRTAYAYYPFNSGTEGIVKYNFNLGNATYPVVSCSDSCTGTQSGFFDLFLVNVEDESYITIYSDSVDCSGGSAISGDISGSLTLSSDTEFMFIAISRNDDQGLVAPCARSYSHREPLDFNISVYVYEPDWNCSAWSTCVDGEQVRTCNDLNGLATPKSESQACFEFANETINIGFDDYYTMDTFFCRNDFAFIGCTPAAYTRDRLYPSGWNIPNWTVTSAFDGTTAYLYDMITLTNEKYYPDSSSENDLSLKMWYTPRKNFLPKFNETGINYVTCNATTEGRLPELWYDDVNETFFIAHNFTALSNYMGLSYRLAKCDGTVQHGTSELGCSYVDFGCNASFLGTFLGSVDYYTNDGCDITYPPARITTQIRDLTDNSTITIAENDITALDFAQDQSILSSDYREYEITNMNISHEYEIRFAMNPTNGLDDILSYCVYIDDVNIVFREEAPSCDSEGCSPSADYDGDGTYDYTFIRNIPVAGGCKVEVIEMYPACVPSSIYDEVKSILDDTDDTDEDNSVCLTDGTLATYDNAYKLWEYVADSPICEAEEEDTTTALNLYLPHPVIQDILKELNFPYSDYAIVWFFLSIFMLINYISIGLGVGVGILVKGESKEGKDFYIPFLAVFLVMIVGSTFGGFYPLEIGLPVIVSIGLMLWKSTEKIVGGG